jgi:pyridoxal phosphate enzyme (YggS family)
MQPSTALSVGERITVIRSEVARAAERAGRDLASITLVGVTKTYPIDVVREAMGVELLDFGENRAQELMPKVRAAEALGLRPHWHFIGHLQRNKVRQVLPHIAALHSLDSIRLIEEIDHASTHAGQPLRCYLEVNVSGEASKQGVSPSELPAILSRAAASPHIEVAGLMTVAPQVADAEHVRPVFRDLRELARAHGLSGLSMGMSEDYKVAIDEGATVIRIGRALFGPRPV